MDKHFKKASGFLAAATLLVAGFNPAAAQQVTIDLARYATPTATQILRQLSAPGDATKPYSVNMTVNGDPCTRMAFAWFTNPEVTTGKVQIVKGRVDDEAAFATPDMEVEALSAPTPSLNYVVPKNYVEGVELNTRHTYTSHKALATGLESDTDYSWRAGNEEGWSRIGHFRTARTDNAEGYDFIYITDTQAQNDEMFDISQRTVHAAREVVPQAQFVLVNGDLVETYLVESGERWNFDIDDNSEWESEQWFKTMQDVWMDYPLVPIQGNHDTSDNHNWWLHFNTDNTFNQTSAVPTEMPGSVYSFVRSGVLFMVINYEDWNKEGYFQALGDWMRQQVAENPDVKWRVATFHKNMFTGSKSHQSDYDATKVREGMLPVFDELNIDVALQGHDHIYEVIGPVNLADKTLIEEEVQCVQHVEGGRRENMTGKEGGVFNVANGTLFFLNNSAGKKKYEPRNEQEMIAAFSEHGVENYWGLFSGKFGQTGEPTFSRVHVTDDKITIDTYTVDPKGNASLYDSFDIIKDQGQTGVSETQRSEVAIRHDDFARAVVVEGVDPSPVTVYNISGQTVTAGTSPEVSTAGLAAGVYVVKVQGASKDYYRKISIK